MTWKRTILFLTDSFGTYITYACMIVILAASDVMIRYHPAGMSIWMPWLRRLFARSSSRRFSRPVIIVADPDRKMQNHAPDLDMHERCRV